MRKLLAVLLLWPSLAWGQGVGGQQITCNKTAVGSSGAATTQVVAPITNPNQTAGEIIAVCGFDASAGAAAGTFQLIYGTGATCGTGTVTLTGVMNLTINGTISSTARNVSTPATQPAQGLCAVVTGTGPVSWTVYYAQF